MRNGEQGRPGTGRRAESDDLMLTRRSLLQRAAALGMATSTMGALDLLARTPQRALAATPGKLPEIQFEIEKFTPRPVRLEGVRFRFPPVYTTFATFSLSRAPSTSDQSALTNALARVEASYAFSPSGIFMTLAYGIPYFERLPGGMSGTLVAGHMPRLIAEPQRYVLEEAVPAPSDVSPQNPEVSKERFDIPVQIESNDMLLMLRSDSTAVIDDALAWLSGESEALAGEQVGDSGLGELLTVTSRRLAFIQLGLPRKIAEEEQLSYAETINPQSPMWMGFASQQVGTSGPPAITTFLGNGSSKLTTARSRDYFNHGSIAHLSHVILDLEQFYERPSETYVRRGAEMFSASPPPRSGNPDQFANGGGPGFIPVSFNSAQAEHEAEGKTTFDGQPHVGHITALQRTSRTPAGKPIHIRADAPGFDSLDVPDSSPQPKLHFAIFVPTADFFATMRRSQASPDLAQKYSVPPANLGLERFLTATRRQNFLVPPRRNRSFPLLELA